MATYDLGTIGYTLENTGGPKSIAELKQLAQAGIEAHRSTTQLSQGNLLAQYFTSVDKQITAVNRNMQNHNRFLAQAGQQSNRFGVVTQQAGYQIGDFLVQVQSGTNWMVAFGQQATQLVGILPLMGAGFMGLSTGALVALSAGLGIAIPLITALGAVWMRTSDEVEVGASKQKQAYESVTQALENLRLERQMEMSGAGSASEQTLLNEVVAVSAERKVIAQELLELESRIGAETSLQIAAERGRLAVRDNELRLIEQRNSLILDEIEAERVAREKALAINDQMLAVELAHARAIGDSRREADAFTESMARAYGLMAQTKTAAAEMAIQVRNAANAWLNASRVGGTMSGGGSSYLAQQYNLYGQGRRAGEQASRESGPLFGPIEGVSGSGRSGGGSGAMTTLQNKMEEVYQYLEQDKYLIEQENIAYQQRQDTLQSALDKKMLTLQEYYVLEKNLKIKHEQDLLNIERQRQMSTLSQTGGFFGMLANVTQAGGQKVAKVSATFGAIEATIAAYVGAAKALADPNISFLGRIAAYGSVLAVGLKSVAAIRAAGNVGGGSTSIGSIGGGGSIGSATVAQSSTAAPAPQTVFIDSIDPDSLYSGETLINLFDAFYNENDKRGKVFVVAR